MSGFFQAAALVLVAVVIAIVVGKRSAEISTVLSIAVCVMVITVATKYLKSITEFAAKLQIDSALNSDMTRTLWKLVGISVISDISVMICSDAGNAAMGKALQFLGTAVMLYLSIPMLNTLLELIQEILSHV